MIHLFENIRHNQDACYHFSIGMQKKKKKICKQCLTKSTSRYTGYIWRVPTGKAKEREDKKQLPPRQELNKSKKSTIDIDAPSINILTHSITDKPGFKWLIWLLLIFWLSLSWCRYINIMLAISTLRKLWQLVSVRAYPTNTLNICMYIYIYIHIHTYILMFI